MRGKLALLLFLFTCPFVRGGAANAFLDLPFLNMNAGEMVPAGPDMILRGGVEFESDGFFLTADEVRYNRDTRVFVATGSVVLTRQQVRLLADRLEYRYTDQGFDATNIRLGVAPYYVQGPRAHGRGEEITVEDATASWGEPGRWKPTLKAARVFYAPGQRMRAEGVRVGIGSALALRLPQFEHGLDQPILAYLALDAGYRSSLGGFVNLGLRVPVRPWMKLGGDAGFYTKRGIMAGPSAEYGESDTQVLSGRLQSGFINDHGDKKTDVLGNPVPENRGYVEWQHRQRFSDSTRVAGQLNYWKDSEIVRDFRPGAFVNVQEPDTFVEVVNSGSNHVLSLFGRFEPNSFQRVQQRLPEVAFDLLPRPIGHGIYEEFHASAAVLRETPPAAGPSLRANRIDTYYQMRRPFAPASWLSFTPVLGGRLTYYTSTSGAAAGTADTFSRTFGQAGFDAELRAVGSFEYRNDIWKIDGLRHLLTPRLSYRFMPGADRDRGNIPPIDRNVFMTYLPPLDFAATRNIDQLSELNVVRIGIDNTLQTRGTGYGSRDLVTLNTAVDYRFQRQGGQRDLSDIHFELSTNPAPWIRFDAYQSVSSRTFALRQLNTALTLRDGSAWSMRFANHFLDNDTEEYALDGTYLLSDAYESVGRIRFDARRSRVVERAVGLRQNIDNTWLVEYTVTVFDGPRREGRLGLNVQVRSIGF